MQSVTENVLLSRSLYEGVVLDTHIYPVLYVYDRSLRYVPLSTNLPVKKV